MMKSDSKRPEPTVFSGWFRTFVLFFWERYSFFATTTSRPSLTW